MRESILGFEIKFYHLVPWIFLVIINLIAVYRIISERKGKSLNIFSNSYDKIRYPAKYKYGYTPHVHTSTKIDLSMKIPRINPLVFVGSNYRTPGDYMMSDAFFRNYTKTESIQLLHIKNVFLTHNCIPYADNTFYSNSSHCQNLQTISRPTKCVGYYTDIISLCHSFNFNYAHTMFDVAAFLTVMPKEIIMKSKILLYNSHKVRAMKDPLSFFGINKTHLIDLRPNEYIFAYNVYLFRPQPCDTQSYATLYNLRNLYKRKLGLDQQKPSRYVLYDRPLIRHIMNFRYIVIEMRKVFPKIPWEILVDYRSVSEAAFHFNQFKLYFGPHGAGCVNIIFMQPNTGFCEVQGDNSGFAYLNISRYFGLHHCMTRIPTMKHAQKSRNILPVSVAIKMINITLQFFKDNDDDL